MHPPSRLPSQSLCVLPRTSLHRCCVLPSPPRCASSLAPPPTAVVCPPLASAMWRPPSHLPHRCCVSSPHLRDVASSLPPLSRGAPRCVFLVIEYVGQSLPEVMRVERAFPEPDACRVIQRLLEGAILSSLPSSLYIYQIEHIFASFICFSTIFCDLWHEKCDMVLIETASSWAPSVQPKSNDCHRPHQYKIMLSV